MWVWEYWEEGHGSNYGGVTLIVWEGNQELGEASFIEFNELVWWVIIVGVSIERVNERIGEARAFIDAVDP
jgi:hypothetical protein